MSQAVTEPMTPERDLHARMGVDDSPATTGVVGQLLESAGKFPILNRQLAAVVNSLEIQPWGFFCDKEYEREKRKTFRALANIQSVRLMLFAINENAMGGMIDKTLSRNGEPLQREILVSQDTGPDANFLKTMRERAAARGVTIEVSQAEPAALPDPTGEGVAP